MLVGQVELGIVSDSTCAWSVGAEVPGEACKGARGGGVVLKAVAIRGHLVSCLVLDHLCKQDYETPGHIRKPNKLNKKTYKSPRLPCPYLHVPASTCGTSSDVQVDHDALVRHGDKHVLAGVGATDLRRRGVARTGNVQGVLQTVSCVQR